MRIRPFAGFLLVLFFLYLSAHTVLPYVSALAGAGRWLALFVTTGLGIWLAAGFSHVSLGSQRSMPSPFNIGPTVLVLLIVCGITAVAGAIPALSLLKWSGLVCQVLLFLYIAPRLLDLVNWRLLLLGMLALTSIVTLIAVFAALTGIQVSSRPVWHQGRLEAVSNPNQLATVLIVTSLGALWELHRPFWSGRWYRVLLAVLFCVALIALYWTGSRSSMIGFLAGVSVWLLATGRFRMLLGGAVLALLPLSQTSMAQDLLLVAQGRYRVDDLFATREGVWMQALENWREQPWFGHGYGVTGGDFTLTSWTSAIGSVIDASGYFGVMASIGIVGIVLLCVLFGRVGGYLLRVTRRASMYPQIRRQSAGWWLSMFGGSLFAALIIQAVGEPWLIAPGAFEHLIFWLSIGMMYVGARTLGGLPDTVAKRRVPSGIREGV